MLRSGLIAKECRSAPLSVETDQNIPNTRYLPNQVIVIHTWLHSNYENTARIGADAGPAPFRFTSGAGPTPAPFPRFGVDSFYAAAPGPPPPAAVAGAALLVGRLERVAAAATAVAAVAGRRRRAAGAPHRRRRRQQRRQGRSRHDGRQRGAAPAGQWEGGEGA